MTSDETPSSPSVLIFLSRNVGDRILLGIFAPIVGAMTGGLASAAYFFALQEVDSVMRIGAYIVADFGFAFFLFSVLAFIWALFAPEWLERLLAAHAKRVVLTIAFLVTGYAFGMIYFLTRQATR